MRSRSGGFWPGEETSEAAPEGDEREAQNVEEFETEAVGSAVTEPEPEPEAQPEPESEPEPDSEPEGDSEPMGWQLAESESETVFAHRPGEIDVPPGIAKIVGPP